MRFLLGGYSADLDGSATGIGMLVAGAPDDHLAGGPLEYAGNVARAASPSWLTRHPFLDVVYAALEREGAVQAFRRTGESSFVPLGAAMPAGEATCHVMVAPDGGSLMASCWGDGRVVRMPLDAHGRPQRCEVLTAAVDPTTDAASPDGAIDLAAATRALREAAGEEYAHLVPAAPEPTPVEGSGRPSRAHQTIHAGDGILVTTDLGLDLVRFWLGSRTGQQLALPSGTAPRHMVLHPSGHLYVVTEASREVYVLARGADAWRVVGATSLGPTLDTDAAAEIALSRDGAFVYAGVRGSDALAVLRVRGEGDRLEPAALVDAGVRRPRHHLVVRDTLLVAGQDSDDVVSFALDERTGVPGRIRHRTTAPSPTCILPLA